MSQEPNAEPALDSGAGPVDMHVHLVGNGSSGSGCWLRLAGWHRPLAKFMLRHVGLNSAALDGDLDQLYVDRLLHLVRSSSLGQVILLAHDNVYDQQGRVLEGRGSFFVPNEYVLQLARRYPEFLPAVSIHPARADALEELDRCVAAGAVMMKCLPNCHNIDCSNPRYTKFWERMAQAGLPLLAHTGGEHTVPVVEAAFANPRILTKPLECGVTVIAAHCGTKSGLADPDYFREFTDLIRRYPNFYGDNSAFNVPIRGRRVPSCLREPLLGRVLHGSDFPVPVFGHWSWARGHINWRDLLSSCRTSNVLERDYLLKKAMGFSTDSFTRVRSLLPRRGVSTKKPGSSVRG